MISASTRAKILSGITIGEREQLAVIGMIAIKATQFDLDSLMPGAPYTGSVHAERARSTFRKQVELIPPSLQRKAMKAAI